MSPLPDDVRAVLAGRAFAHIATTLPDGAPHSVPVWIDVDPDDRLVMFTQTGSRKARNIARDGRVAISATDHDDPYRQVRPARPGGGAHRRRGGPGGRRPPLGEVHRRRLPVAQPEHRRLRSSRPTRPTT